jgi:hypothetical protein
MDSTWNLRTISIPTSDRAFAQAVQRAIATQVIESRGQLEDVLRSRYPRVRVRARELSGEPGTTWYVYRDRDFPRQPDQAH